VKANRPIPMAIASATAAMVQAAATDSVGSSVLTPSVSLMQWHSDGRAAWTNE
jgi:hypothetical protein